MANHKRRMFILLDLPNEDRLELAKLFDEHATLSAIERYAYRHLKVNTHSVRYAGVGKLSDEGVPARVGMKITGLASPGPFSHYVQQRQADKALLRLAFGDKVPDETRVKASILDEQREREAEPSKIQTLGKPTTPLNDSRRYNKSV